MKSADIMRLMGDINLLEPDPDQLSKVLMREQARLNTPRLANAGVEMSFHLSYWGHKDAPTRAGGEAYIFHPVRTAIMWVWCQFELVIRDHQVTQGILTHDTTEDAKKAGLNPKLVHTNIAALLGHGVANDVYYNTKQEYLGETGDEFFRRLIASGLWRPIVIRLLERTDNVETLSSMPFEKQIRKIRETERWRKRLVVRLQHLLAVEVEAGRLPPTWLQLPAYVNNLLKASVKREVARIRKDPRYPKQGHRL